MKETSFCVAFGVPCHSRVTARFRRVTRHAMTPRNESPDITLRTLTNEPIERMLPKEPTEPTEKADPVEPIDMKEFFE